MFSEHILIQENSPVLVLPSEEGQVSLQGMKECGQQLPNTSPERYYYWVIMFILMIQFTL